MSRSCGGARDAGLTLVELLVTTTLLGVALSLATLSFLTGLRATDNSIARVEASDSVAAAVEAVGRGLRTAVATSDDAPAFGVADRSTVTFTSTLYASCETPSTVSYSVDSAGTLTEVITPATGAVRRRILAHDLQSRNLFVFHRAQPDPTDATKPQQLAEISTVPVTGDGLAAIRAVDTSLSIRVRGRRDAPTVSAQTRTFLVNANTHLNGGAGC